jgi:hypothetical protein
MKEKSSEKKKLEVIIEKNDCLLWGRIEDLGNSMPTPYGKTKAQVIKNLRELINDYVANEGKKDKYWNKIDLEKYPSEDQANKIRDAINKIANELLKDSIYVA